MLWLLENLEASIVASAHFSARLRSWCLRGDLTPVIGGAVTSIHMVVDHQEHKSDCPQFVEEVSSGESLPPSKC